jgi:sec-independent protein translocase protein TatA
VVDLNHSVREENHIMAGFGVPELLIILLIVIVLFGASRLAGVGAALGKSVSEFRRGVKDDNVPTASVPIAQNDQQNVPLR